MGKVRVYEIGERYGRLTVIELRDRGQTPVHCRCDCGAETSVSPASSLLNGNTKSCGGGCNGGSLNSNWRGGKAKHPLNYVYHDMISRCYRPTHAAYANYGGRGITVCDRWRSDFWAYAADMGERPAPGMSIDRVNNDGPYSPENCRWATHLEQRRNQREGRERYAPVIERNLRQVPITHCRRGGHEYTPENTKLGGHGYRYCRTCLRERKAARRRGAA